MAEAPLNNAQDLSAGDNPEPAESKKVNDLLDDAASRRRYRTASFLLSMAAAVFFCILLYKIACAITFDIQHFSPWIVGIFGTLVVAVTVLSLALLKATFAPPEAVTNEADETMPQLTALSQILKTCSDTLATASKAMAR